MSSIIFGPMQLFFSQNIEYENIFFGQEELHHLKVTRKKIGDSIIVVDGKSNAFRARIEKITRSGAEATIISAYKSPEISAAMPYHLHLVVSPSKNLERMEWLVEKVCELGIQKITFISTEHSERKKLKFDRLHRKAISAMKQSKKSFLPKFQMLTINEFLVNEFIGTLCIAHCQGSDKTSISNIKWQKNEPITIMIGPEGDFTPKEIHLAEQKGFKSISLGSSRLRTETAALFAVTCVYAHFS